MSSQITFIGDVMLGRMIGSKYDKQPYNIVAQELQDVCKSSDLTIANLESPVTVTKDLDADHLQFVGSEPILKEFSFVNLFTLANNHINDAAETGMDETIELLERNGFKHNGLFRKSNEYQPYIYNSGNESIAIVTVTDMMNIPFDESNKWQCLRVGENRVNKIISQLKAKGFFVIVYAHIGALFTRFPNPATREFLRGYIESGAGCVVTAHSHCLGGMETYKGIPVFHSLGDFVMDGNSFRRRRSAILTLNIEGCQVRNWFLTPAEINDNYETVSPSKKTAERMLKDFGAVSMKIEKNGNKYKSFYKWQYKKEMIMHTFSTLHYLIHTKGIFGMIRLVFVRFEEVFRMFKWVSTDRSNVQRDDDAILPNRKKFKQDELFKN